MLVLAFSFLFLGYGIKVPYVVMMGWILLFLLFVNLMANPIEYKTGEEETYIYGANFSDYHWDYYGVEPVVGVKDYELFHKEIEDKYSEYTNKVIFIYLSIISGMGFISVFFTKDLW